MPNNAFRKLFSRSPKLPATAPYLGGDATPSAANAPPHSPPHSLPHSLPHSPPEMKFTHHSGLEQNCNNVFNTDNRVDNRVDNSITNINFNYQSRHNELEPRNEPSRKVHFMVPYSRNEGFVGISQTLVWLEEKIKGDGANHHRVALWGMGGVGKTQDVLECIYHYRSSQQFSVFWIHAGSQLRFEKDYRKLAGLAGLLVSDDVKEDIRPIVKSWLEGPESGNWILVLDNADNKLDFFKSAHADGGAAGDNGLADFIPHGSKGTVIITARDRQVADWLVGGCNILVKTVMDKTHARQLFVQNYPKATEYRAMSNEDNSISLLLEALQYLPLGISQVAAYLRQNTLLLPSEYLKLFMATKEGQKELLSKPFSDIRRECQLETVLATFSISFRQVQEQSPLASSLLQLMACIDNQCIPYELLAYSMGEDDQKIPLVEALNILIGFGLLSIGRQGKDYEMHSLVHVSISSFMSAQEKDAAVKQIVKSFRRIYPKVPSKSYDTCILYLAHAFALVHYMKGTCQAEDRSFIYSAMSLLSLSIGNTSAAEGMAKQAVEFGTDICGPEDPDTLLAITNLASTYQNQGRLKEAVELGVQVMEAQKRMLGPEHRDTFAAMHNLASIYKSQGRLKEAVELRVQVMEAWKRMLGPEHPDTLTAMNNLALTYGSQGRLKEAVELGVHVMEARKRMFGPEHPDTLTAMNNLALTYQSQGRLKEAVELGVQAMEARKRMLGPEHPKTLTAMNNLASIYGSQGRLKEAVELGVQVMEARKRMFGPEHPDTLTAMNNLASTYWSQGRLKEAVQLGVQVMATQKRVLGPEHPHTLMTMNSLASAYRNQGRLKEAEEIKIQIMEVRRSANTL